jgi:hypothetical protein
LFGLFFEQLDTIIRRLDGVAGYPLADQHELRNLLYADDVALISLAHEGLQKLLDSLQGFCTHNCMKVNTTKTVVSVFVPQRGATLTPDIQYANINLPTAAEFRYLGVHCHNQRWFSMAADKMVEKASKAMWALCAKVDSLGVKCMEVKLRLFDMLVMSIGNYGCQIWGVDFLRIDSEAHVFNNPLQKLVFLFLRTVSGAYRNTSRWTLLREFGLLPTQVKWATLCARWWNRCLGGLNGGLMQATMRQDVNLFCKGMDKCWSAKFLICMGRLNLLDGISVSMLRRGAPTEIYALRFSEAGIKEAFVKHYEGFQRVLAVDPRSAPSLGLAQVKYAQWFAGNEQLHLKFSAPQRHMTSLYRFRLGSIPLKCYDHSIPDRMSRVCGLCNSQTIEDEKHILFECRRYEDIRKDRRWIELYDGIDQSDIKSFMNQKNQRKLSNYIHYLLWFRNQSLRSMERLESTQIAVIAPPRDQVAPQLDTFSSSEDSDDDDDDQTIEPF